MEYTKKFLGHLKTVLRHKRYVFKNCCKAGLIWRGLIHDMSKFSPTEFLESVEWYQGSGSPIDACKKAKGFSMAWQHHKGRNSHHYEYWVDYLDDGGKAIQMPFEDALEMICDSLGAGQAYAKNQGKEFSYQDELNWWENKKKTNPKIHKQTLLFFDYIFNKMALDNSNNCLHKSVSKYYYEIAEDKIKEEEKKNG